MLWFLCFAFFPQDALLFVKPEHRSFAGETEFALDTTIPEEVIVGLELFINGRSAFYFENKPYETTIDLREYPDGEIRIRAVLLLFGGKEHVAELEGKNIPGFFEQSVQLVRVPVMIQDAKMESSLQVDDFKVFEEDIPQKVELLFDERKPLYLVVLLDLSGSMLKRIVMLRRGMRGLIDSLKQGDTIHVIGFNHGVFEISPPETDFEKVKQHMYGIEAAGSTNLYGAIWSGIKAAGNVDQRRALLVFTDGGHDLDGMEDHYGKSIEDCNQLAKETGVPVYTMGLGQGINPEVLEEIAEATGGKCFLLRGGRSLQTAFKTIGSDLRHQYLLCYYTQSQKAGWHEIRVSVRDHPPLRYPKRLYFK